MEGGIGTGTFAHGIFSRFERDVVAELVEADEGVTKGTDALLAQGEVQHDHGPLPVGTPRA